MSRDEKGTGKWCLFHCKEHMAQSRDDGFEPHGVIVSDSCLREVFLIAKKNRQLRAAWQALSLS